MLKKTITYQDYDGNIRKEDFYFNLTKAECMELEMSQTGGLSQSIERIVAAQDGKSIIETIKGIILKAYGEKGPDGRKFIKNDKVRDDFVQTEAYSQLFMELATDASAAAAFVDGIVPKGGIASATPAASVTPFAPAT